MRILFLSLIFAVLALPEKADAQESRTPVYDDAFVWHVATKLTQKLLEFQVANGIPLTEEQKDDFGSQYDIIYHNYLIRCDGPLPRLEALVGFVNFEIDPKAPVDNSAAYAAALTTQAWLELDIWARRILAPFMNTFASGKYGFFPDCIVPAYFAKNVVPGVNIK